MKMELTLTFVCAALAFTVMTGTAQADLRAGVSRVSITPLEEGLATQLGGYGDREGKPAEGIHDTIYAKTVVFDYDGHKSALVTMDVCSLPRCLLEEAVAKAAVEGLTPDYVIMSASHSHAGLEGMSMDRRNIANNKHIGVFDEAILNFAVDRVAKGIQEAAASMQAVTAGSASVKLPGMNRNRRGKGAVDDELTVLRLDGADLKPLVVFANYTAHGTIMTEKQMLISGGWAGNMQRTVESLMGPGVTCMYSNGAEGDQSPTGAQGGSRWEMAENYGRRMGMAVADLANTITPTPVESFLLETHVVALPPHTVPPHFIEITGSEYNVTEEQIQAILPVMFPSEAPLCALRVNDFAMVTFPGEPVCVIGLAVKNAMRAEGITHPCVASLTNDLIGYILTKEEYEQGGYEVTTSFYGPDLGPVLQAKAAAIGQQLARVE
ncbi:MAG: hypothetical protein GY851_22425 [bacterium]|nr:hypothetical protein [bacterium]